MTRAVAAVLLAALAGCTHLERPGTPSGAPAPARLDELLAFADPSLCEPGEAHARFLTGMVAGDANAGFRAGRLLVPAEQKPAFGRIAVRRHDGWWTIGVPVEGALFGLPLKRVVHSLPEGGDPGDVSHIFAAPVLEVERVLRARGLPAKAGGDVDLGPPEVYRHYMALQKDPETETQSILTCGYE